MPAGITEYAIRAQQSAEAVAQAASANRMGNVPAGAHADPEQAKLWKLKKAATQFEAMLLEKWWASMKKGGLGGEDDSDAGAGTLDSMGMQAMSMAIASAGGIGIAAMLVHSLQGEIAAASAAPSTAANAQSVPGVKANSNQDSGFQRSSR
jgi:Rod binding domain-containing protein